MTNIAIMGLGIVGGGVAELLMKNADSIAKRIGEKMNIKYILDIKDLSAHPLADRVVTDINRILDDPEITIVAELMGGSHPAYEFSMQCLKAGKSVVTSNKEVVANYGHELLEAAKENHVYYLFEASVGGGIPVIRPICQCLAANEIYEIDGILNGTTNYILSQMFHHEKTFDVALREAQEKGYAEKNPAADVDGIDACRKIAILSALAFGRMIPTDEIDTTGITKITQDDVSDATKYGGTIKLIGSTAAQPDDRISISVAPCIVPHDCPLSSVEDVFNGILVKGDSVGDVMFYGRGAGNLPTASAVVADIIDIMTHSEMRTVTWEKCNAADYVVPLADIPHLYYVRLKTTEKAGTALKIVKERLENITVIGYADNHLSFTTQKLPRMALTAAVADIGIVESMLMILES